MNKLGLITAAIGEAWHLLHSAQDERFQLQRRTRLIVQQIRPIIHHKATLPNLAAKLSSHFTSSVYGGLLEKLLGWSLCALRPSISNASIPEITL